MSGPVCPSCGSENLRVVYRCDVIQPVRKWKTTDQPGTWEVDDYGEADADLESNITDEHVECGDCATDAMKATDEQDVFEIIEPPADPCQRCIDDREPCPQHGGAA